MRRPLGAVDHVHVPEREPSPLGELLDQGRDRVVLLEWRESVLEGKDDVRVDELHRDDEGEDEDH